MAKNPKIKWLDAEQDRPKVGSEIIFIDSVGMHKGTFLALNDGVVYVDGKQSDSVSWSNIYQWIEYPEQC